MTPAATPRPDPGPNPGPAPRDDAAVRFARRAAQDAAAGRPAAPFHPPVAEAPADLVDGARRFAFASRVRPHPGFRTGGDATVVVEQPAGVFVGMIDVLGHGLLAGNVSRNIDTWLREPGRNLSDVDAVLAGLDDHLRGGLGAAAGLLWCDRATGHATYTAVGNTVARHFGPPPGVGGRAGGTATAARRQDRRLIARDGTLGSVMPSPRHDTLCLGPDDTLLFYTDGLSDRFDFADVPGLALAAPATVVETLVDRFGKDHDDASAICLRYAR